ncbi:TetR family transcriptional regulator [Actinocrispum wychmicini]|uniref:TetR family transcriptional regulator n=1 Tax=Actinocrispum wychmicini TaxID=1213861 RepID=A0A4R2JHX7_9PSEU|nr:TetR family transcriptional regulator [Actinocrispum wychmicini]TCO56606.1 TetR family transcriptional regulator [Actinocrispum wychmicini]
MARAGRRPGQTETREQILTAARAQFAALGYDGATIRGIAAEASVNPALVHHFFGTKEQVFVAAMQLPVDPALMVPTLLDGPRAQFGERMVRFFLTVWGNPDTREPFLALMRSVMSNEQAVRMLRQFISRTVLAKVADGLGVPRLRMAAAASHLIGLAIVRYIVAVEPLASADDDEIVALVGPVVQHYVDG